MNTDDEMDAHPTRIDLLEGVPNVPPGWSVEWQEMTHESSIIPGERASTWSLQLRMPELRDPLRSFLMRKHLWDLRQDMPCAEYLAVADAAHWTEYPPSNEDKNTTKLTLGAIAWDAITSFDQSAMERLSKALKTIIEMGKVVKREAKAGGKNETFFDQYHQQRDSYRYRQAFAGFCYVMKRIPTKKELSEEASMWTQRIRAAQESGHLIPDEIVRGGSVQKKSMASQSEDRKAAGFDWLPDSNDTKGHRSNYAG
jgi:hypothetical protein